MALVTYTSSSLFSEDWFGGDSGPCCRCPVFKPSWSPDCGRLRCTATRVQGVLWCPLEAWPYPASMSEQHAGPGCPPLMGPLPVSSWLPRTLHKALASFPRPLGLSSDVGDVVCSPLCLSPPETWEPGSGFPPRAQRRSCGGWGEHMLIKISTVQSCHQLSDGCPACG